MKHFPLKMEKNLKNGQNVKTSELLPETSHAPKKENARN